ncbi:MAG: pyrroline-5-carboxylate reductase [Levilactobacillus sp.]|jgi:pyrroline-5-carboxylate reductase|uniref:Pyrroline-5-carboxylate reductase n=1 Tax=Levilactobacillus suantsaiihabitans TaxID=2487722 RepID=A0A4Z0J9S1_9LACO|nr:MULTISPECIES: pyrroline-5-carboxylate reductase [Levilactobacillus]MCH4124143.1 pyrroline-5-carboxylate reductase [Levilactobacillus sp.]MCI1554021.1 pyrroline-5-carboxylate reductase [Levilactobacillus sp.]MCI1598413.1 pyrroline-5-carboxylate reductase [Levilactobacillus sp.]MCI1606664.1 pyrroline-5-carboxylate reductase [Levilactobacillus sp.]TGD18498.1 pyrroline-5-carboxylate reductase [Levilactobacillus suantsaiihabitans]
MKIGFIGVGGMAQAIIGGLLQAQTFAPADIVVHSHRQESYGPYAAKWGLTPVANNAAVVTASDLVVLAVTPNVALDVLQEVEPQLANGDKTLISIVAGLSLEQLANVAGENVPILRTLPNVNVEVGAGMTAVAANDQLTGDRLTAALRVFNTIGSTTTLAEDQFGVFSALAGSSPAYIDFFIDSLSRAGVKHGLSKDQATQIAAQATLGSAKMVLASDKIPFALIDQVASPGGSTVAGLLAMEEAGFMTAVVKGIDATIKRDAGGPA